MQWFRALAGEQHGVLFSSLLLLASITKVYHSLSVASTRPYQPSYGLMEGHALTKTGLVRRFGMSALVAVSILRPG